MVTLSCWLPEYWACTTAFDATTVTLGARHLKAGQGDVKDETGYVAAVSHDFANGLSLLGEVAHFDGFGGTADDADYATLGASYGRATGPIRPPTPSATSPAPARTSSIRLGWITRSRTTSPSAAGWPCWTRAVRKHVRPGWL